jgi:hypothetical protein
MTNVNATLLGLCTYYTGLGNWFGLATGNPGANPAVANEASGGSPAYARQSATWTVTGAVALASAVIINVPAGTYSYLLMCSASSGAFMVDWCGINPQVIGAQNTLTIVPLATMS